jgi:hypothetical protein
MNEKRVLESYSCLAHCLYNIKHILTIYTEISPSSLIPPLFWLEHDLGPFRRRYSLGSRDDTYTFGGMS